MPKLEKDQYTKAEAEDLIRETEEAGAEALEVAQHEAQMSDAEKAVYKTLDGDEKSEFLFATTDERATQVAAAEQVDDDPVIYKSATGTEFRKSDDPRLVDMAKERDQERKDFLKLSADRAQRGFEKRADEELPNLPGDVKTRAAILKAIDGIEDETVRDEAHKSIKAQNAKMAGAFKEVGQQGITKSDDANNGGEASAHAELDEMAKQLVKDNPEMNYYDAYEKVTEQNTDLAKRAVQEG